MSTIVSLLLSIVIGIGATISGIAPVNNPHQSAKETGIEVSQTANTINSKNFSNENNEKEATRSQEPKENFGSWVSSLTPQEPKADGAAFGEKVSSAAKEKDQNESDEPEVEEPTKPVEPAPKPIIEPQPLAPQPPYYCDFDQFGDSTRKPSMLFEEC